MTQQAEADSLPPFIGVEALVGALAGGLLMAVVQLMLDLLFAPMAFRDGQYPVTYFMWTLPFGAVAGALATAAFALARREQYDRAGNLCIGGGFVLGVAVAVLIPQWDFRYVPVVAAFYFVAFLLVCAGFVEIWKGNRPGY